MKAITEGRDGLSFFSAIEHQALHSVERLHGKSPTDILLVFVLMDSFGPHSRLHNFHRCPSPSLYGAKFYAVIY